MDNPPIIELNAKRLKSALMDAIPKAFDEVKIAHEAEQLYAFALYSSPEALYIMPSANTEEGLTRVAQRYLQTYGGSLEAQRAGLRWNPDDWAYHLEGESCFHQVAQIMGESWSFLVDYDGANADLHAQAQVFETCIEVLQILDAQGVFGQHEARQNITLLLTMGDIDNAAILAWAKRLNPTVVYERLTVQLTSQHP